MQDTPIQKRIYADAAATTPLDPRVRACMEPYFAVDFAHPESLHREGSIARSAVQQSRRTVASTLHCQEDEVVFTSGGTESNSLAIAGHVRALKHTAGDRRPLNIIRGAIEHSSVRACFDALAREGVETRVIPVDSEGFVDLHALEQAITPDTVLVSVCLANNEIGTIERMRDIARIVRAARRRKGASQLALHTDASQAGAWISLDLRALDVDLMTLDGHKMYGPKGIGCLYVKRGVALEPLLYGGGEERVLRPGTPPVSLIVGFAEALARAQAEVPLTVLRVSTLRDRLIARIRSEVPSALFNGPRGEHRLANNVNFSFPGLDGEQIVIELDARGVACSTRSACLYSAVPGSLVVQALGKGDAAALGTVRLSFLKDVSDDDIQRLGDVLTETVLRLYDSHVHTSSGIDTHGMI